MTTPRIPDDIKPLIAGYRIGSPDGVINTSVGGGMPRTGLAWDRGKQQFDVSHLMAADKFFIWSVFFHRVINSGSVQFIMPIDSGDGMKDHLCVMLAGTYSAARAGKHWTVAYSVVAENMAYQVDPDDAQGLIDLWNDMGSDMGPLLDALDELATMPVLFA